MANPEHVRILNQGVEIWNKWRTDTPDIIPDLSNEDIHKEYYQKNKWYPLKNINFKSTILTKAKIQHTIFTKADLQKATFRNADLSNSIFTKANLRKARLRKANLKDGIFLNTNLKKAIFDNANLSGVHFNNSDLRNAKFQNFIVDGKTLFQDCKVNKKTDFRGVGLDYSGLSTVMIKILLLKK